VVTACHTSSHSQQARDEIGEADVIVATHGTALDLLRHYPDVLPMSMVSSSFLYHSKDMKVHVILLILCPDINLNTLHIVGEVVGY